MGTQTVTSSSQQTSSSQPATQAPRRNSISVETQTETVE